MFQALALLLALAVPGAPPPLPSAWVSDDAGFLSEAARQALNSRLQAYQGQTGHHVLVWISRSTGQEPIEDFAVRAFAAWQVGRKGLDDGVVLFVFSEDRKARIEVGYGLEAVLPDAIASRILREAIVPRIQAQDRDGAIQAGVDGIVAAIEGRLPAPTAVAPAPGRPPPGRAAPLSLGQKVLFGIVGLAFLILLATNPSLALFLIVNILSSGSRGSSGGGYSGGGGRSGGGGATGSW